MLQDIAVVTGANFISEDLGKKMDGVELSDLGHAHRVVSNKDKTIIVGGKGNKNAIDEQVKQIKAQIKTIDSDFDKEKLQERLGKLSGGVAIIKVGAPTESAQKELKQRVEDAVVATRALQWKKESCPAASRFSILTRRRRKTARRIPCPKRWPRY